MPFPILIMDRRMLSPRRHELIRRRLKGPEGQAGQVWREEGARLQGLCSGREAWERAQARARKEREERVREEKGREGRRREERAGLGRLLTAMEAAQARKEANTKCEGGMVMRWV